MKLSRTVRSLVGLTALFALVCVVGCKSGPRVVKVTGILKYKGTPVTNAHLTFLPDQGRQSWAETDGEGKFKINYDADQDGAVVGNHKVWIEFKPMTRAEQEAVMLGKAPPISKDLRTFFDKYSEAKTTLKVEIKEGQKELNLDLD